MYRKACKLIGLLVLLVLLASTPAVAAQSLPRPTGDDPVEDQTVALGKPGTVYRYHSRVGITEEPYLPDAGDPDYLNHPIAMLFDSNSNLYVVEEQAGRLLKFNPSGRLLWATGQAGIHDWLTEEGGLKFPKEVAIAPDGTLWVVDGQLVAQFNPSNGSLIRYWPDVHPENITNDDLRFYDLRGIAFDSGGRMYLADMERNRIQVFTFSSGNPVYAATIGVTDQPTVFNRPAQIVIDSANNVYVADTINRRVRKCAPTSGSWPWGWNCTDFVGTIFLNGDVYGLGIDGSDIIYITDSEGLPNNRILGCTAPNNCGIRLVNNTTPPTDVAIRPMNGWIYMVSWKMSGVYLFDGTLQGLYLGHPLGKPYVTDEFHLNGPRGVEVDANGSLYVVEELGQRLLKFNKAGEKVWEFGEAGIPNEEDAAGHLYYPAAAALDRRGNLWVVGSKHHVRLYNSRTGAFKQAFDQGYGDGDFEFKQASGIAIDSSGFIYIADAANQRVMVYNQSWALVRQLGVTGECGVGSDHFCNPHGLAVDQNRNLYVADKDNCRVQKFDRNGNYLMTFGNGLCGSSFSRLNKPVDVAVDSLGRVYILEEANSRFQVYDRNGAFLTGQGLGLGTSNGLFRNPAAIAVDPQGMLYIADWTNHRVQKFSRGVRYWGQVALNGLGKRENGLILALAAFKNQLYASPQDGLGIGAQLWRMGRAGWETVVADGFEDPANSNINALIVFRDRLYAAADNANGAQIWRSLDGLSWEVVMQGGFGSSANQQIAAFGILAGKLCAAAGGKLWCSPNGEMESWLPEVTNGFGHPDNSIVSLLDFNGASYAGTRHYEEVDSDGDTNGGQLWRKLPGGNWQQVNNNGFGDPEADQVHSLAVFNGWLYAATRHQAPGAAAVYRCKLCDGSDWQTVTPPGLPADSHVATLAVARGRLYAVLGNWTEGLTVWETADGLNWKKVSEPGLGDSNNILAGAGSVTTLRNSLYLGTLNMVSGGEIWKFCRTARVCR